MIRCKPYETHQMPMNPCSKHQTKRFYPLLLCTALRTHQTLTFSSHEVGASWDLDVYGSLLKKCDSLKALRDGMCIHHHIVKNGHDCILSLNNLLLQMYGRCNALQMVRCLFSQMHEKDRHSWTHMIRAYTRQGLCKDAFLVFRRMQEEGLVPNSYVFSSLLSTYSGKADLYEGQQVHVQVASGGVLDDDYVGTALIDMYGKCGSVEKAQSVFGQMQKQDAVIWNTMMALYIEHGLMADALELYDKMLMEGTLPTDVTYLCILNACCSPSEGKRVQVNVLFSEYNEDNIVGTAFLNMYGKWGFLKEARRIFDDIHERDEVCWNAMIAAHAQNGQGIAALQLFFRMWQEGLISDKFTFGSALSACANEGALAEGKRVHSVLSTFGSNLDTTVGNTLVNMYGKCGDLEESWRMFCGVYDRDVVSWNAVIGAYTQNIGERRGLQLFAQMYQEGFLPNNITFMSVAEACSDQATQQHGKRLHACAFVMGLHLDTVVGNALANMYANWGRLMEARMIVEEMPRRDQTTYVNILSACTSKGALGEGQEMHNQVVALGFDCILVIATALVNMYGKCSRLEDSWASFVKFSQLDVILWTAIISAFIYNGQAKDALCLFEEMQKQGMKGDEVTMVSILDACADHVALAEGRRMHNHVMVNAFESDLLIGTAVLNMYGRCGMLEDAYRVFKELPKRDTVAWSVIVAAYAQHGHAKVAQRLLDQMKEEGVVPNEVTFIGILNACSHSGLVDEGREWFRAMRTTYGIAPVVTHYNCMIDLLARAGLMEEAEALIKEMPMTPTSVTWSTLLGACKDQVDKPRGDVAAENAFELAPGKVSSYVALTNIYLASSKWDAANFLETGC